MIEKIKGSMRKKNTHQLLLGYQDHMMKFNIKL